MRGFGFGLMLLAAVLPAAASVSIPSGPNGAGIYLDAFMNTIHVPCPAATLVDFTPDAGGTIWHWYCPATNVVTVCRQTFPAQYFQESALVLLDCNAIVAPPPPDNIYKNGFE